MPLLLSSRSVDALIAHCERHNNYDSLLYGQFSLAKASCISRGRHVASSSAESNTCGRGTHTAIQIEANESTPLLLDSRRRQSHDAGSDIGSGTSTASSNEAKKSTILDFRLFGIVLISVTGLLIASYLLITESRRPLIKYSLDLVSHDTWSKTALPLGAPMDHSNVVNVMVAQTGGKGCVTSEECVNILKEMQAKGNDGYSFLIGDDGLTYEVRGWDQQSGLHYRPKTSEILIGFIGEYTKTAPSEAQLRSALSLIRQSIRRKKLQRPYKVYGIQELTANRMDGNALFNCISKWKGYEALRHVS